MTVSQFGNEKIRYLDILWELKNIKWSYNVITLTLYTLTSVTHGTINNSLCIYDILPKTNGKWQPCWVGQWYIFGLGLIYKSGKTFFWQSFKFYYFANISSLIPYGGQPNLSYCISFVSCLYVSSKIVFKIKIV